MLLVYLVLLEIPLMRDFYELTPLPADSIGQLLAVAVAWTAGVHLVIRTGIVFRVEDAIWGALVGVWRRLRPARDEQGAP
jgi:hypothetical protein